MRFLNRNLLIEFVYPFLAEYCKLLGVQFWQPSEMRWGIREEASDAFLTEEVLFFSRLRIALIVVIFGKLDLLGRIAEMSNKSGNKPHPYFGKQIWVARSTRESICFDFGNWVDYRFLDSLNIPVAEFTQLLKFAEQSSASDAAMLSYWYKVN